jgi:hypothetical protein
MFQINDLILSIIYIKSTPPTLKCLSAEDISLD